MNSSTDTKKSEQVRDRQSASKVNGALHEFSERYKSLPNYVQIFVLLVSVGLALTLLTTVVGFLGSLFTNGAQQSGPALSLQSAGVNPSPSPSPSPSASATPEQRKQLWDNVVLQYRNLESRIETVDDFSRQVMANTRRQEANTKCAAQGAAQCRSDFQFLMRQFLLKYQQFSVYTTAIDTVAASPGSKKPRAQIQSDKMVLNADNIQNYRRIRDELLDLAYALSTVGNDSPQFTLTVDLNKSLADYATALQNYEVLRQQEATQTYQAQPTTSPSPAVPQSSP